MSAIKSFLGGLVCGAVLTYLFLPTGANCIDHTTRTIIEPRKVTQAGAEKSPRSLSHGQSPVGNESDLESPGDIKVSERFYGSLAIGTIDSGSCRPESRLTLMLNLSREEGDAIENAVKSTLLNLRSLQNSIKQLKHDEDGDYYSIPPFPEGLELQRAFVKQIKEIFPNDPEKGAFLARLLSNDVTVLNFGKYEERVAIAKARAGHDSQYIERALHAIDGSKLMEAQYDPQLNNAVGNSYKEFFR